MEPAHTVGWNTGCHSRLLKTASYSVNTTASRSYNQASYRFLDLRPCCFLFLPLFDGIAQLPTLFLPLKLPVGSTRKLYNSVERGNEVSIPLYLGPVIVLGAHCFRLLPFARGLIRPDPGVGVAPSSIECQALPQDSPPSTIRDLKILPWLRIPWLRFQISPRSIRCTQLPLSCRY